MIPLIDKLNNRHVRAGLSFSIGFLLILLVAGCDTTQLPKHLPRFRMLVLAETEGLHAPFVDTAKIWLNKLAADSNLVVDYIENTQAINDSLLNQYQVIIQLNYPPYGWPPVAGAAFEKYISEGKGGWIGFHHASLLGEFDGYPMWQWFSDFMGGIRYENYIAGLCSARVMVEDSLNPVMKDVPSVFTVENEEWYTYDKSPRAKVHVLAHVDESSYQPDSELKMGDHPVIWTNEKMKARNVYIFMGHHSDHFRNKAYTTLFRNAIFWTAETKR